MSPDIQTNAAAFVGGLIYLALYTCARRFRDRLRVRHKVSIR